MTTVLNRTVGSNGTVTLSEAPGTGFDVINPTKVVTDQTSNFIRLGAYIAIGFLIGRL